MAGHRSDRLLPWIAAERTARGLLLVGVGVYLLSQSAASLSSTAVHLARLVELDPHRPFIRHLIARLGSLSRHQLTLFGVGAILYGLLELVEGVGLFMRKRWAEWLTVIATSLLIPFEIYELVSHPSWLKSAGLVVNVLIVLYLIKVVRERNRSRSAHAARA
jgi:uncharacterized membrane protein (DUF2068 family)